MSKFATSADRDRAILQALERAEAYAEAQNRALGSLKEMLAKQLVGLPDNEGGGVLCCVCGSHGTTEDRHTEECPVPRGLAIIEAAQSTESEMARCGCKKCGAPHDASQPCRAVGIDQPHDDAALRYIIDVYTGLHLEAVREDRPYVEVSTGNFPHFLNGLRGLLNRRHSQGIVQPECEKWAKEPKP